MSREPASLQQESEQFADDMTRTVRHVLGEDQPRFVALMNAETGADVTRFVVRPTEATPILVTIGSKPALELKPSFYCVWDHRRAYLAVESAKMEVRPVGREPALFRYEYVRRMQEALPCAHLQVHAHRDEFVYQLVRGGKGRRATRRSRKLDQPDPSSYPVLADVHFPLGGHRFRPCLEDVLQMLVEEFGVDCQETARTALEEGRADWRRKQVAAAARDAPETAARVLSELGYTITTPPDGHPQEQASRLRCC